MKKGKVLGNIVFWITLISPMLSFALASIIGEANIFGVAGIVRYSWIMWLFIPIGILSILIGLKLKKNNQKYTKNFVIAFICVPLLVIWGSYRFIFNIISYDVGEISTIEEKINLKLPDEIKIATIQLELYNVSYVKIIDDDSRKAFESEIGENQLWKNTLNLVIKSLLPLDIQYETDTFESFVFYNITSDEYNTIPSQGEYECIFIAYDYEVQRLIILDDYKVKIN